MPIAAFQEYLRRLPARQAELKLVLAEAISLPQMKERDHKAAIRRWMREAGVEERAKPATSSVLKLLGIGIRHANKPG